MYHSLCCKDQSSLSSNRSANMDSPASSKHRGTALHQGCAALAAAWKVWCPASKTSNPARQHAFAAQHQAYVALLCIMSVLQQSSNCHQACVLSIVVMHQESGLVKCSQPGIKVSTYHSASVSCTLSWIGVVIVCGTIDMSWRMSAWVSHNIFSTILRDKIQQVVLQQKTYFAESTEVYNTTILLWYSQAVTASICSLSHVLSL